MIFLAGLLNRSSLSFIFVSIIRLLSILAILFAVAVEVYLVVLNFKAVHKPSSPDSGSPAQNFSRLSNSTLNSLNQSLFSSVQSACGYIDRTNVPTTFGGIFFFILAQIFNVIVLLFCLLSELSFPPLPQFFQNYFPPLGQSFGVGVLGSLEVYVASTLLSHHLKTTAQASIWSLFIVGVFNILLGVTFGRQIRSKRSLLDASTAYVKKTAHVDEIETGFNYASKGTSKGKKIFRKLRPSMIGKPQETDEKIAQNWPAAPPASPPPRGPLAISGPIIDYIQHRKTTENSKRDQHTIALPVQPEPAYSSFKKSDVLGGRSRKGPPS